MSIKVWTDPMQHAELFGKPVLFTNWLILRDLVPKGWHCYDLQGTQNNPNGHAALVDRENIFHTGTILSPQPLKREGTVSRRVNGSFHLLGEEMTLEQFCEKHDLEYPQDTREFILRPASPDEAGLFYSMDAEEDRVLGTVGHLRIDFGHGGKEFWHTWWPHNDDQFNTPEFKDILQRFVDSLRQDGPLKDLKAMSTYCWQHGGPITEDKRSYGYLVEVGNYRLCLRCTPVMGDYSELRQGNGQKSKPLFTRLAVIAIRVTVCCWMTLKCSAEPKRRDVAQIAIFAAESEPLWRRNKMYPKGQESDFQYRAA